MSNSQLTLTIQKQFSILNNIICYEVLNVPMLQKLMNSQFMNTDAWLNWANEKQQLQEYIKKLKGGKMYPGNI